jgi:hypothetical protein
LNEWLEILVSSNGCANRPPQAQFDAWRADQISAGELNDLIHRYDTGIARKLYQQYTNASPVLQVAYAIVEGILKEADIPEEVWPYLQNALAFYHGLDQEQS